MTGPLRWILEIHFVDRAAGFGGFQESLLFEADELDEPSASHVDPRQTAP